MMKTDHSHQLGTATHLVSHHPLAKISEYLLQVRRPLTLQYYFQSGSMLFLWTPPCLTQREDDAAMVLRFSFMCMCAKCMQVPAEARRLPQIPRR